MFTLNTGVNYCDNYYFTQHSFYVMVGCTFSHPCFGGNLVFSLLGGGGGISDCFWEVIGEKGHNLVYIWLGMQVHTHNLITTTMWL